MLPTESFGERVDADAHDRVLVLDGSALEAAWLSEYLRRVGITSSSGTVETLEDCVQEGQSKVVVVDAALLDEDLADRLQRLALLNIIVLTDGYDSPKVDVTPSTVLTRHHRPEDLVTVIRGTDGSNPPGDAAAYPHEPDDGEARKLDLLTEREMEVLRGLLRGAMTERLADSLGISPNTMRTHIQNVLSKLGVHSRLEAVALALRAGVRADFSDEHRQAAELGP